MSVKDDLHERVARVESQMGTIAESLQEIKQELREGMRDLSLELKQGMRDLNQRIDRLILWGCSTILGTFIALSLQLWLKH